MALYSPKLNLVFLHIYKTAGTSLRDALIRIDNDCKEMAYGHADYSDLIEHLRDEKIFSVVRNPYDWIYSLYQYGRAYNTHPFYAYCATHSFDDFIKWYFKNIDILNTTTINGKLQTQTEYVSFNGKISVDYILKMENLENDFIELLNSLRQKGFRLNHLNATAYKHIDYSELSRETIDIINEKYHQDFINFNYTKL
jgi:hypothetical protein